LEKFLFSLSDEINIFMKTIGLIGGMSWESSKVYYELINKITKEKLGAFHSSKNIMISVDFAEVEELQKAENWQALDQMMADAAKRLELAGAECVVLCTNTMHICTDAILQNINIPFIHIGVATGKAILQYGLKKIALLGTKFTMEKDFYKSVLSSQFGIETITPNEQDMLIIHNIIYEELVQGQAKKTSREKVIQIINKLKRQGAEGVILGCTGLPMLISNEDVSVKIFDTTSIHASEAVAWALE